MDSTNKKEPKYLKKISADEAEKMPPESDTDTLPPEFVKLIYDARDFVEMTYANYLGVLEYLYEEQEITLKEKNLKKALYEKQKEEKLAANIEDVASFIPFYELCRKELKDSIEYAKEKTGVGI